MLYAKLRDRCSGFVFLIGLNYCFLSSASAQIQTLDLLDESVTMTESSSDASSLQSDLNVMGFEGSYVSSVADTIEPTNQASAYSSDLTDQSEESDQGDTRFSFELLEAQMTTVQNMEVDYSVRFTIPHRRMPLVVLYS